MGLFSLRILPRFLLLGSAAFFFQGCYVLKLGLYQNNLINGRRPVPAVIQDPSTDEATRIKLKLTQEILTYARTARLNTDGAYQYFVALPGPVVSYLVQAAEVDKLESVTWWFPVVGRVPYLGFFNKQERDDKAASLKQEGYDISIGGVGAFSSLGWFDDPIYSSMLRRDEAELANLYFHELTHRTLWISGSAEFNENLAEFVAGAMTQEYLKAKNKSDDLVRYLARVNDRNLLRTWLRALKSDLQKLYDAPPPGGREALLAAKAAMIVSYTSERRPKFAETDLIEGTEWNNASILGASLYSPDVERFAKAFHCQSFSSYGDFLNVLRDSIASAKEPLEGLDRLCSPMQGDARAHLRVR